MKNKVSETNQQTKKFEQLYIVTSFSKYVALVLFVLLPFVGAYVGYSFAPEKVVEIETEGRGQSESIFEKVESISWSTWFGMCAGYCSYELSIDSERSISRRNGWNEEPEKLSIHEHSGDEWKLLLSSINIQAFLNLPETIGCPDCADGGGESVKINFGNGVYKKVNYHYGDAPDSLESLVQELEKIDTNLPLDTLE